MQLTFLGAARTVTGSMHLLNVRGKRVLIECGLFQGRREECYKRNTNFPFDPASLDAVVLTHAHIDHSGNIPGLVKRGYRGPVYATPPTVDLCAIMLKDSAHIQESDIEWVNRIRKKQGLPPAVPLYSADDARRAAELFVGVDYNRTVTIAPGVECRFLEGGHILGSAGIHFEIEEPSGKTLLTYAGDIGRVNMPVINDPNLPRDQDVLIMESTYGNRHHDEILDREEQLAEIIRTTAATAGKVIIPAFAVGRTQELVYILHKLYNQNRIPDIPLFVDSPLALAATTVFRDHPECFDRETLRVFAESGEDPFEFSRLKYVREVAESKALNGLAYPHVIISASGMAEGGRVVHHLRNGISDRRTTVLFVGHAVKHTLARRLLEGNRKVRIFGEEHRVNARILSMDTFSAHADRRDLLDYVKYCPPSRLKHIFLVHGEPDQALPLKDALRSKGYPDVHYPEAGGVYEL